MTGPYRKQKESMMYVEERGEKKGRFKKCYAVIKVKVQEANLEQRMERSKMKDRKEKPRKDEVHVSVQ